MTRTSNELLASLPETFRYSDALDHLSERQLRRLISDGRVIAPSRGLYRQRDWLGDEDLIEIAVKAPRATLCLRSALARHGLIDDIPAEFDIAIPRGSWTPESTAPVRWRHFDRDTFEIGRNSLDIGAGRSIGLYSAERSTIDAFRIRHLEGADLANEALKPWLRRGASRRNYSDCRGESHAQTRLRETLEPPVSRVTRGTAPGDAYLDLQNQARRTGRPTQESGSSQENPWAVGPTGAADSRLRHSSHRPAAPSASGTTPGTFVPAPSPKLGPSRGGGALGIPA